MVGDSTVEGSGDGYTDETIIAVTVTVPNVAITSPGNMTAMQTSTTAHPTTVTVSASADAMNGDAALTTLALYADGVEIGGGAASPARASWSPSTDGKHALTAVATYANGVSVTSPVVDVYSGTLSVNTGGWEPEKSYTGDETYGTVTASASGGLVSDGSGPFFVTYHWETATAPVVDPLTGSPAISPATGQPESAPAVWESDDGGIDDPFALYNGNYAIGWLDGWAKTQFNATFWDAGYYIMEVKCVATVHDSETGGLVGTLSATSYIGGDAADLPAGAQSLHASFAAVSQQVSGHGHRAHMRKPSSSSFWASFSRVDFDVYSIEKGNYTQVWTNIGGLMAQEYGPPLSTNSCGARMSYGLNYCGSKIPKLHEYQTQQNVPGDGMNYITGAENMGKYLTWAYDAPTHSGFNAYAACKEYGIDVSSSEFVRLLGMTGNQVAIFQAHADPGTDGSDPVHSHVPHTGAIRSGYHDDYLSTYTNVDIWLLPNR